MKIDFSTSIYFEKPLNSYEKAITDVDTYFALLKAPQQEAVVKGRECVNGRTYFVISLDKPAAHPLALRALAIASCFTIIIPLIMLLIKVAQRANCYFKALAKPITSSAPPPCAEPASVDPLPKPAEPSAPPAPPLLPKPSAPPIGLAASDPSSPLQVFTFWQTMQEPLTHLLALDSSACARDLLTRLQTISTEPASATTKLAQIALESSSASDDTVAGIGLRVIQFAIKIPTMTSPAAACLEGGRVILSGLRALGVKKVEVIDEGLNTPLVKALLNAYELCQTPDASTPARVFTIIQALPTLTDMRASTITIGVTAIKAICNPLLAVFRFASAPFTPTSSSS